MSAKTLTDELRSVLLFHSLEAPQPNATVDRILNDTVGSVVALTPAGTAADAPATPARRISAQHLVAASVVAVLLLAVAGINSARNRTAVQTASTAGTPSTAGTASRSQAGTSAPFDTASGLVAAVPESSGGERAAVVPPHLPAYAGRLDCASIPGGRLVTGQWDDVSLGTGDRGYLYEFLCVGQDGQRSASELQVFQQVGNKLRYKETLLPAADNEHLDFMTGGASTVRMQASIHSPQPARVIGEVVSTTWDLSAADPRHGYTFTVAEPCQAEDLAAAVIEVPDAAAPAWRLALRNRTGTACALEGYPQVRAQRAGVPLATAVATLSGTAGGVRKAPVPPIIVLSPDATASAIIEQSAASAAGSCPRSDELAVTLPTGVALDPLPAQLSGCGLAVHPLVGNARGAD